MSAARLGLPTLALLCLACLGATVCLEMVPGVRAGIAARLGPHMTEVIGNRLALLSVAVLPVLTLEAAVCGWRNSSAARLLRRRSCSAVYDLLCFALHLVSGWRVLEVAFSLGLAAGAGFLLARLGALPAAAGWQIHTGFLLVDCVLAFLAFTFADYWIHRALHAAALWPLHRMHHTATEMSVLTLWRNNPVVSGFEILLKAFPLAFFDIPPQVVGGVGLLILAYEHLIHSNIGWHWGWIGRWLLHPPAAHWVHHSTDPAHYTRNLGIIVAWDRLFGTWADPRTSVAAFGVAGGRSNTGYPLAEIIEDIRAFVRQDWRRPAS